MGRMSIFGDKIAGTLGEGIDLARSCVSPTLLLTLGTLSSLFAPGCSNSEPEASLASAKQFSSVGVDLVDRNDLSNAESCFRRAISDLARTTNTDVASDKFTRDDILNIYRALEDAGSEILLPINNLIHTLELSDRAPETVPLYEAFLTILKPEADKDPSSPMAQEWRRSISRFADLKIKLGEAAEASTLLSEAVSTCKNLSPLDASECGILLAQQSIIAKMTGNFADEITLSTKIQSWVDQAMTQASQLTDQESKSELYFGVLLVWNTGLGTGSQNFENQCDDAAMFFRGIGAGDYAAMVYNIKMRR